MLAAMGLRGSADLQRPDAGPFTGATIVASVDAHSPDERGDPRYDVCTAVVRLWNEAAPYDLTPQLVETAAAVEERLRVAGFVALPRDVHGPSWSMQARHTEWFDG